MRVFPAILVAALLLQGGCSRSDAPPGVVQPPPPAPVTRPATATTPEAGQLVTADSAINLELGENHYQQSCASCHDSGAGGAPLLGDQNTWESRIDQGLETLVHHAIDGFKSSACVMPPKGGDASMQIEAVALAVRYMVEKGLPPESRRPSQPKNN